MISERIRHDERWMTSSTTEVEKSSFSEDNNTMSIRENITISLWFNVDLFNSWIVLKTLHVKFIIEMTNVSNNSIIFHFRHLISHNNVFVTSSSDEDISLRNNGVKSDNINSFHKSLKCTNRVTFSNINSSIASLHGLSATFTNISKSTDNYLFTRNHYISSSHDSVWERMSASIDVIEFGFSYRIIDIDSWE